VEQKNNRNLIFISLSQFGMAFSVNFIVVILPFYVFKISSYSPQETLLWVGWIMGSSSLVMTIASNFWGFLTCRFSPKLLYLRAILAYIILFLLMGFTSSLHLLLILRILQGLFGGVSTVGLVIIASSSSRERIAADIGLFQTFQTLGHLIGPLIGSLAASVFGYRGAFISVSVALLIVLIFCHLNVKEVPLQPKKEKFFGRSTVNKRTILGWLVCLMVMVQLMFLPSVLPNVFEKFSIEKSIALKWAGLVIMLYTATATLGTYLWSRLSVRIGRNRVIFWLVILGTLFQSLLSLNRGMVDFIVIRMIQTGLIAATIPLVISIFATEQNGGTIGFLNSARFAGNALGPIMGTSILALSNLTALYLFISGLTLLILIGFMSSLRKEDVISGGRA
jgi:DHA1 family multidrug resistance protein-like MFS transporter